MYASRGEQITAAVAASIVVASMIAMLIFGLRIEIQQREVDALVTFELPTYRKLHRPPHPIVQKPSHSPVREAQSPRNLMKRATEVVAVPVPPILTPPAVIAAPTADAGAAAASGASLLPDMGLGAGHEGLGRGGGGNGNGNGGEEESVVGPKQIAGKLSMGDLPEGLLPLGASAEVGVIFRVMPTGKVSDCEINRSSDLPTLDRLACHLIEERFRFRPARNRTGRPVSSRVMETQSWYANSAPTPRQR